MVWQANNFIYLKTKLSGSLPFSICCEFCRRIDPVVETDADPGVAAAPFATAVEMRLLKIAEICAGVTGAESSVTEFLVLLGC